MRDILTKILHIVDKRRNFNLHAIISWLLYFSLSFKYNLATIGVLDFVVVIDVYAQPTREKIKFYRTASQSPFDYVVAINSWIILHLSTTIIRRSQRLLNVTMVCNYKVHLMAFNLAGP